MTLTLLALFLVTAPPVPACLQEAVVVAQHQKGPGAVILGGTAVGMVAIDTPFSRVVNAAVEAKSKLQPFTVADIRVSRPIVTVAALPILQNMQNHYSVTHLVIRAHGSNSVEDAIQPLVSTPTQHSAGNALGGSITEQGMNAEFPLEALTLGRELYVVFEGRSPARYKIDQKMLEQLRPTCQ